jgi:hypothetical protein
VVVVVVMAVMICSVELDEERNLQRPIKIFINNRSSICKKHLLLFTKTSSEAYIKLSITFG